MCKLHNHPTNTELMLSLCKQSACSSSVCSGQWKQHQPSLFGTVHVFKTWVLCRSCVLGVPTVVRLNSFDMATGFNAGPRKSRKAEAKTFKINEFIIIICRSKIVDLDPWRTSPTRFLQASSQNGLYNHSFKVRMSIVQIGIAYLRCTLQQQSQTEF